MAEVEDVARPSRGFGEDRSRPSRDDRERRETHGRIEIALNAAIADARPGIRQPDPPVDAHDLARHIGEERKQLGVPGREVNARDASDRVEDAARVRSDRPGIVLGRQRARP